MTDETTKECACGECDTVTWCSREPLYVGSYVVSHIWLCNACVVKRAQERKQSSASKPRAIIRHFAAAMERKLALRDESHDSWRESDLIELMDVLLHEVEELRAAWSMRARHNGPVEDVLLEAVDVANYAMFIADVAGALPPTDDRGR